MSTILFKLFSGKESEGRTEGWAAGRKDGQGGDSMLSIQIPCFTLVVSYIPVSSNAVNYSD
jgi:hypothetical protein